MTVPPSGDPYAVAPPGPDHLSGPVQPDTTAAPVATVDHATCHSPLPGTPSDAPTPYDFPAWGPQTPFDGVSVGALVTGIVGLGLVPVGLGIAGIVRTGGGRRRGRGFAIAGLVLGALSTVVWGVVLAVVVTVAGDDEALGSFAEGFDQGFTQFDGADLEIGECFDTDLASVGPLVQVDCSGPHTAETFVVHDIDAETYPGEDGIDALSEEYCTGAFEDYVGTSYDDSSLDFYYFYPTETTWALGDRRLLCGITAYDGSMLEGSIAGSGL